MYLLRTGYNGNNVSNVKIASDFNASAMTESNLGVSFSVEDGYIVVTNNNAVKKKIQFIGVF